MKKVYNEWLSTATNTVYRMETNWLPKFGGWELLGTVEVEQGATPTTNRVRHLEKA